MYKILFFCSCNYFCWRIEQLFLAHCKFASDNNYCRCIAIFARGNTLPLANAAMRRQQVQLSPADLQCARDNALPPALVSLASCNSPTVSKFDAPAVGFSLLVTSARGVSHAHPLLCFEFCFTLFLLASFYQKPKKN
jgi:hypothetical protein